MGYCYVHSEKRKSFNVMRGAFAHNYRLIDVPNADPAKAHLNEELIPMHGKDYETMFHETISNMKLQGASGRVKKDNVLGLDIVMTFSREDKEKINLDEWKKVNVKWLNEYFNPPEAHNKAGGEIKTNNAVSAMFHGDEEGAPHIHAFVIPMNDRGELSAKYYTGGKMAMSKMQTSYAKAMEPFGLKRGLEHSVSKHQDIKKYYTALNRAIADKLPELLPGENAADYKKRADIAYEERNMQYLGKEKELKRKIEEAKTYGQQDKIKISERTKEINRREHNVNSEEYKLSKVLGGEEFTMERVRDVRRMADETRKIKEVIENYPNRDDAEQLERLYKQMIHWQEEQDRKERKKEKERQKEEMDLEERRIREEY